MPEFALPILGFNGRPPDALRVQWADGTYICGGILGDLRPETLALEKAEQEQKQELRNRDVVVLDDYR